MPPTLTNSPSTKMILPVDEKPLPLSIDNTNNKDLALDYLSKLKSLRSKLSEKDDITLMNALKSFITDTETSTDSIVEVESKNKVENQILYEERDSLYPITHDDIWSMYKKQEDCLWRAQEIDLSKDMDSWNKLTDNEQYFIKMVLAFFATADGIVIENLGSRFQNEVKTPEISYFYLIQSFIESVHAETYSLLIDSYIKNNDEKNKLYNSIQNFPCIKKKAEWAQKWINDETSTFATRLVAFACVEGIFFSGAFCAIYWLKKRGLMPGLTFSNELISRDEALHTEFAVMLFNKLDTVPSKEIVQNIIKDAVEIEKEFICEALPCKLISMNSKQMSQYIEFVADRLAIQLGCDAIYNASNPFDFMELISIEGKTNFFEKRVGEYALANKDKDDSIFDFDAAF